MKDKILKLLKNNQIHYISGEEISNSLGVTRAAIWKHVKALKEDGYEIDSIPRQGYRLMKVPDRLYPQEIMEGLDTCYLGKQIIHYSQVTSTNELAKQLAGQGAPEGTVVIAEEQTGGKGRLGRHWSSPEGVGVWLSLIFRPRLAPIDAPKLTIMAAVALAEAIEEVTNLCPQIKWPNDMVFFNQKMAGILTEMNAEMDSINYVILGIGVNVNAQLDDFPTDIRSHVTSLRLHKGDEVSRVKLVQVILRKLEYFYGQVLRGNFVEVLEKWRHYSITLGRDIRISGFNSVWEGRAVDIDETGALIVETPATGKVKVTSGDVTIRNINGKYV